MSTLYIREYEELPVIAGDRAPMPKEPGTDQTPLTFSTSAASAAFASTTRYVRCYCATAWHYVVAETPTATTNAMPVGAGAYLDIAVPPGYKIAAINAA